MSIRYPRYVSSKSDLPNITNNEEELLSGLRELQLIDRILGLEAENAQLQIRAEQREYAILSSNLQWKIGGIFIAPIRLLQRVLSR